MKISQLSEVHRVTTTNGKLIILYSSLQLPVPEVFEYQTLPIRDVDDIRMILTLHEPALYIMAPTRKLEWETLQLCHQGYRVYNHPTTMNIAVECLKGCRGATMATYRSLWEAVRQLGK